MRCSTERLVLRNFLRVVDALPFLYVVGGLCTLVTRRGQRVGDLAAGTLVVRVPRPAAPEALAEIRTRHNSLRQDPQARAGIRQRLSPREAEVLALAAHGLDNRAIAERLALSVRTVEAHRTRIAHKLEVKSLAALFRQSAIELKRRLT